MTIPKDMQEAQEEDSFVKRFLARVDTQARPDRMSTAVARALRCAWAKIEELEKALDGRTVSCVCGGLERAERSEGLVRKLVAYGKRLLFVLDHSAGSELQQWDVKNFREALALVPAEMREEKK